MQGQFTFENNDPDLERIIKALPIKAHLNADDVEADIKATVMQYRIEQDSNDPTEYAIIPVRTANVPGIIRYSYMPALDAQNEFQYVESSPGEVYVSFRGMKFVLIYNIYVDIDSLTDNSRSDFDTDDSDLGDDDI
ncbi:hypothetical protein C4573_02640 [Candidatus Woesearchaeota archaeon]|nr:MAG: hypothetical protein C4573_02640 [Candidatus Woesearchaeota archaeon]